ncbi:class I SAM-dependent methyltransferase [Alphaproteobacteria bacterium]|nr:class I SAM-dependent methyltransferase [Alphaproteobacteria bacterium]
MKNTYKNKTIFNRISDKIERRNRGSIYLIIKNFIFYIKSKIKKTTSDKRAYILEQLKKNCIIIEVGVWQGEFSNKIYNICSPKELVLVDSWTYDKQVRGCAPQVDGKEPLSQKFFDDAKNETYSKFKNMKEVLILDKNSIDASSNYNDNYFDYIYLDAEHTYQAVSNDLDTWYPKLKINGVFFGDDYYWREEDGSLSLHKAYQDFISKHQIRKWCVFKSQITLIKDEKK